MIPPVDYILRDIVSIREQPQDQRTETVERLFPAEDRFRLPERRSEGLGRMEAGKPFPEQEEKPERAPGRERIRPMRASGRLQHEDMPPEQFSGVVPYDGGWEAEEVEMHPEMEAEAHKREVNTNRVDLPEYSSFDGSQTGNAFSVLDDKHVLFAQNGESVWADMTTIQGIGVLSDGTLITGRDTDPFAEQLYEVIRAETAGEISKDQAKTEKMRIAWSIAVKEHPWDDVARQETYNSRISAFLPRDLSYYEIPDVTGRMESLMESASTEINNHLGESTSNQKWFNKVRYFRSLVKNGGPYDIKLWPEFQAHSLFIYNGEVVSRDALGNILYGYLGKTCDLSDTFLCFAAGVNQDFRSTSDVGWVTTWFDDPRDNKRILEGIEIYKMSE